MAARNRPLNPRRIEEMKDKIRATLLIKRLEDHVFVAHDDEAIKSKLMSDSQVKAALGLLGKVLPNVTETKLQGDPDSPLKFELVAPWLTQSVQARNS